MGNLKEIELKIPNLGEAEETEIIEISVKAGDTVSINDPLIVLESEKAAMEVPSDYSGKIKKINVKEGDSVKEGQSFLSIEIDAKEEKVLDQPTKADKQIPDKDIVEKVKPEDKTFEFSGINAGPAVRKFAREMEIDLKKIRGTGNNSMITKEDLKHYIQSLSSSNQAVYASLESLRAFGDFEISKQTKVRALGAKNLHSSWTSIPHVTHFEEIDITIIENQRKSLNKKSKSRITPLAYVVEKVSKALKEFPIFNSSLIGEGELMLRNYINIGIAVDTPDGLLVPVMHEADKKDIHSIASEVKLLAEKAKNKKLHQKDLTGGTFTISSLGPIGGTGFTPIINPPEVGILGVSRSKKILKLVDGAVIEYDILPITLSYDHRVINGADAGRFMIFLKEEIEKGL